MLSHSMSCSTSMYRSILLKLFQGVGTLTQACSHTVCHAQPQCTDQYFSSFFKVWAHSHKHALTQYVMLNLNVQINTSQAFSRCGHTHTSMLSHSMSCSTSMYRSILLKLFQGVGTLT